MNQLKIPALSCLLAFALVSACDQPPPETDAGADDDAGTEVDAGGSVDAGPSDGGMDASADAGSDAGTDAGPDAGPDAGMEPAPIFRNDVATDDEELANQALAILEALEAATATSCPGCYEVSRANIRHLWDQTMAAWETCFADLELMTQEAAQAAVACFQTDGSYDRDKLGVFATGAHFDWFGFAFRRALGAAWETPHETFVSTVRIPSPPETALTQEEFDILTEWFLRGTPFIERALPHGQPNGTCETFADASVVQLVADGEASGWSARNLSAGILMHDCSTADPLDCMQSYPNAADTGFGAQWATPARSVTRVLFEVPYNTSYWTKTSADGRFVGHGGGASTNAAIVDLQRQISIGVQNAQYDPGFFPDNSGFMFQGGGTRVCQHSVLTRGAPTMLTLSEMGCTAPSGVGLYQHVGASLDGDDMWIVDSLWDGDPGGANVDPPVRERGNASLTLHRLVNTATGFEQAGSYDESIPFETAAVVSPTMRVLTTQIGDGSGNPIGFVMRRIDMVRNAGGQPTQVDLPVIARYCYPAGKAALAPDDRFIVTHHRATAADAVDLGFTGPSDPGFAAYNGISNIYLIDLITGERTRISNMQPGQRALFPSFRSDGWIYYVVRDGSLPEYIVATDAAIRLR